MLVYFLRRLLAAIPLLLGISVLLFLLIRLPPGGPIDVYVAGATAMSRDEIIALEQRLGLREPLLVQYTKWLHGMVAGDWGQSFRDARPVLEVIFERVPASLELAGSAMLVALLVSIPTGVIMAVRSGALERYVIGGATALGISMPSFWLGLAVIVLFSVYLDLIPTGGRYTLGTPASIIDRLHHLLGPALVTATVYIAAWSRFVRGSMLEVIRQDYIRTAHAKGLRGSLVLMRHALRNALIPLITVLGMQLPHLVSTSVAVEVVFSWPGVGRLILTSIQGRDYPVVMGCFMVLAVLVILGNLIADLMYVIVDPRIRYE